MVNPPKLKYGIVPNASENMQGWLTWGTRAGVSSPTHHPPPLPLPCPHHMVAPQAPKVGLTVRGKATSKVLLRDSHQLAS